MYCRRVLVALIVFLCLMFHSGCAYTVNLNPNIAPTANIANPIPLKVGIFIPEETKSLTITDKPRWNVKYTFKVGESIQSVLIQAIDRVFVSYELLETYPTSQMIVDRNLDLAVIAKVTSAMTTLNLEEGFFQNDAQGSTSISVQLTFYTTEMLQFASVMGSGMGIGSEGMALSTGKKEFSKSVESAIRNLGDDLIQQMYGNYDIRKKAE